MDTQQTTQSALEAILSFIDSLIDQKNIPDLTPEIREELRKDALERLDRFILERTIDAFSAEDAETFGKMVAEKKSDQELQQFTAEHIPDYQTFMTSLFGEFQAVYLK